MSNDYRKDFMTWWNNFQTMQHDLIADMQNTVEDSPYHREDNVFIHTKMVTEYFIKFTDDIRQGSPWKYEDIQGAVACVFHDMGKPDTEEEFFSEKYQKVIRQYKGHEVVSAAYFMDCWCKNEFNVRSIIDDLNAFYNVWVMVAYHLPYNFKDNNLQMLRTHMEHFGLMDTFTRVLLSDCHGRIQDEREKEIAGCYEWIERFRNTKVAYLNNDVNNGEIYTMVGVPASGKSTMVASLSDSRDVSVVSFDSIRQALFPDAQSYHDAFVKCEDYFNDEERDPSLVNHRLNVGEPDKLYGFSELTQMIMRDAIKKADPDTTIIFDNTSLTRKSRRIINAVNSKEKRKVTAVQFIRSLDELIENENSRTEYDKRGIGVIKRMYFGYFPVLLGEVDDIKLIPPKGY